MRRRPISNNETYGIDVELLFSLIKRKKRLEEEKMALASDISNIFAEATNLNEKQFWFALYREVLKL